MLNSVFRTTLDTFINQGLRKSSGRLMIFITYSRKGPKNWAVVVTWVMVGALCGKEVSTSEPWMS